MQGGEISVASIPGDSLSNAHSVAQCDRLGVPSATQIKPIAAAVNKTMTGLARALPMYVWLVALPQLCSRLTHPHPDAANLTRNIITRVFMAYPQQVQAASRCTAGDVSNWPCRRSLRIQRAPRTAAYDGACP